MKYCLTLLIFINSLIIGWSQTNDFDYAMDYVSTKQGLPQNYVSKIVSDSLNVKWIAQETGLTRYDGINFSKIEPGPRYPELRNENIETLFLDSKNRLWIGTKSGGISMLDIKTNVLENYNDIVAEDPNGILRIISITEDGDGNMWFGSFYNGLFVFNPEKKELVTQFDLRLINCLLTDSQGDVWVAANTSVRKYDLKKQEMTTYYIGKVVNKIIEDKFRNCLWISTNHPNNEENKELYRFNIELQKIESVPTNIQHNQLETLYLDRFNRLWVGTWGDGLYRSNSEISEFHKVKLVKAQNAHEEVNYRNILDIYCDQNNVIWLSTTFAGVVKLTESKGFENIDESVNNSKILNELNFHSIYKDEQSIWLGTIQSGVFTGSDINNLRKVETVFKSKIYSISPMGDFILVGANRFFYILDKKGKLIHRLNVSKATSFYVDGDILWVGTQQLGISQFDISDIQNPVRKSIFNIFGDHNKIESNRITSILKDQNGIIWAATYNGLHMFNISENRFIHQNDFFDGQLPNIINSLYSDDEFLWAGTANGLFQLKYENNKLEIVQKHDESTGLLNDFICGLSKDGSNNLWFTTPTNLIKYDIANNSFKQFGKNDGVSTSLYNIRSFFNYKNELIFAGGADNLTYFNPSKIIDKPIKRDVIITQFKIDGVTISPRDSVNERVILNNNINYTNKISLSHKEKSMLVSFAKNDYRNDIDSYYRYRLLGYEDEWNYLNTENEVNFMGLPPGSYELQLSVSDDNVSWLPAKSLEIEVWYAPWSSPLAYAFYILFGLLIIGTGVFFIMKELHERNKLKKEQELSEAKFTFFTNISHEFRTPLTLILSPLKELTSSVEFSSKTTEKLRTMEKNANRLLNLINQLLDFRKAGHGLLKLNVDPGDFVSFSKEVFLYFKEMAASKKIQYNFISDHSEIVFPFDRNKMEIVLCNLISNSLKYSKTGGEITLTVGASDANCVVTLSDTGYGMDKDSKKKIFDRFYQINSTNTTNIIGSGIGLSFTKKIVELHHGSIEVDSKLNKGTVFTISFPLAAEVYQEDYATAKIELETSQLNANFNVVSPAITDLKVDSKENTVLIVDDNAEIRDYLEQLLIDEYNVLRANDGVEAIEVASEEIPDLILCDIMMPRKDGLDVCKHLKEQVTTSHIPIILLTARSANLYEIQSLETGADDFITKPFDPEIIKARISTALQNRAKLREHFVNKVRFEPTIATTQNKDAETEFIEKVIRLVESNLMNEQFGIETIMDKLYMSQSTLYRKIKSLTGLSLTGFIRSIRLKKAAEIILKENEKLSAVSLRVGFNDYKYFGESFKKQFGCLPSEYKSMKKKNTVN